MFCDEVTITLIAGKGGAGAVSMRKEKFIAYGGPDGGDGGRGGNVILEVDNNVHTLSDYKSRKNFKAENGQDGMKKKMHGRTGKDCVLKVPPGTLVFEKNGKRLVADLTTKGERFTICTGGRGGFGNAHFTSSTRKTPRFAEKGEPGEEKEITLELKMIAEVGIIGLPSAGKSTLIAHISNAKPKIADYPFTTLVPNLGVVNMSKFGGDQSAEFIVADVPGLIEGASEGKGLGHTFLKHVQRTKVLIHMVDGLLEDLPGKIKSIEDELAKYDSKLSEKPAILVLNKIDTISPEELEEKSKELKKAYKKRPFFTISAVTGEGIKELLFAIWRDLEEVRKKEVLEEDDEEVIKPQILKPLLIKDDRRIEIKELEKRDEKKVFRVNGKRLEQIVIMSDLTNEQALQRVYDVFMKMGITKRLAGMGAEDGDIIIIGNDEIEFLNFLE